MKRIRQNGVFLTVLFAFVVTFVSVSYTFFQLYKLNEEQYINGSFSRYSVISQIYSEYLQRHTTKTMLEANLAVYGIYHIYQKEEVNIVLKRAKTLKKKDYQEVENSFIFNQAYTFSKRNINDIKVTMLEANDKIYFYIESKRDQILLEDKTLSVFNPFRLHYAYIFIMGFISISFIMIFSRIAPLRRLHKKIAAYGSGDMNINFKSKRSDEIALVANELDMAQSKINQIIDSRTLFLRNIMHELKTPIAKGRIASAMIQPQKQQDRFNSIFSRLENLISEFALIEEITSGHEHIEMSEYRLIDLIDGAIDMAMSDDEHVQVDVEASYKVEADYKLFATAIKNMIDNAIKYAPDKKIAIFVQENEIVFESIGDKLAHPLSYYIEPFTKDNPSKNSFGLGLYLVDAILRSHSMVLAYERVDEANRFIFVKI